MNMMTDIPPFQIKNAFRDPRAAWFQDDIRRAMLAARSPGQVAALPPSVPVAPVHVATQAENMRAVLQHLSDGEDGRAGINAAVPLHYRTMERLLRALLDRGHITRGMRDKAAAYRITPAGLDAAPTAQQEPQEEPPKAKRKLRGATAANVDMVFRVLSMQPATRAALERACSMGSSTVDECLRTLREQDAILWVRCTRTNVKTYKVKP